MQLLLVRHALPHRSDHGRGADPELSEIGVEQAAWLPAALACFPLSRLVSSPQRRSVQTAEPVAAGLGLPIDIDERLAEYDRQMAGYVPLEELPGDEARRLGADGRRHLPASVDEVAFRARITAGVADIVAAARHDRPSRCSVTAEDQRAAARHPGTRRLLSFPIDYASITRLLYSRSGRSVWWPPTPPACLGSASRNQR